MNPQEHRHRTPHSKKNLTYTLADAGIELPAALSSPSGAQFTQKRRHKNSEGKERPSHQRTTLQGEHIMGNPQTHASTMNVPPAGGVEQQFATVTLEAFGPVFSQMHKAGEELRDSLHKTSDSMVDRLEKREAALRQREKREALIDNAVDLSMFSLKTGIVVGATTGVIYIARAAWRARNAHLEPKTT